MISRNPSFRDRVKGQRPVAQPAQTLCAETQGREIVAAMVNEAVDKALGLAFVGGSNRESGTAGDQKAAKPTK